MESVIKPRINQTIREAKFKIRPHICTLGHFNVYDVEVK